MDFARKTSEERLKNAEKAIGRVYEEHSALLDIEKEFMKYMNAVKERTQGAYRAYVDETGVTRKAELKKAYEDEVKRLTANSKQFNGIVARFTKALADANQSALDLVNEQMAEIYAVNYNQVATECKRVGIEVNDKG